MRRIIFYLSVALLAFGISSFVVFKFYFKQVEQPVIAQTTETNPVSKPNDIEKIILKNLPCEDKNLQLVWNDLKDETTSVSAEGAKEIKDCSDIIEVDEPVDLNNDGQKEVVIRGWRSPYRVGGDGVAFWIFQKGNKKDYRKLYEAMGSFFELKNTKTKGYRDILSNFRSNSAEYHYTLYNFNGTRYIPKQCWWQSYLYKNKDGDLTVKEKPKITFHKCKVTE